MSGGVDSSAAAALLKRAGFDTIGVFMKFWSEPLRGSAQIYTDKNTDLHRGDEDKSSSSPFARLHLAREYENRCCTLESERRARKVAKILKIPFYVFNFEKEFKKKIVDCFLKEYKAGRTPNPCVVCNKEIKFGLLLEKALALGADYVATGHYSRIKIKGLQPPRHPPAKGGPLAKLLLLRAEDKEKDQSYFLWKLSQKQLKHILFPVGNYTKPQVRNLAKKFKLPVSDIRESQEICFISENVNDFLKKYIKETPGDIIDKEDKKLGKHKGLWFYTIGQRKGIGLAGGPWYVLDKDFKKNLLIVTKNKKDLYRKELIAKNINWILGKFPKFPLKIKAKIRYRHKPAPAKIYNIQNTKYKILFDQPQPAITPGQSVVFYRGDELLGGGAIC